MHRCLVSQLQHAYCVWNPSDRWACMQLGSRVLAWSSCRHVLASGELSGPFVFTSTASTDALHTHQALQRVQPSRVHGLSCQVRALNYFRTWPPAVGKDPLALLLRSVNAAGAALDADQREAVMRELKAAFPRVSLLLTALAHER